MNQLVPSNLSLLSDKITNIDNFSSLYIKRLHVCFSNGYALSIVFGLLTRGFEEGLYEIAPLNKKREFDKSLLSFDGDVRGYLTKDEVIKYIRQMASLK